MEANNMAAMREACQKMLDLLMLRGDGKARCVLTWDEFNESQLMLRAVLAEPVRNCEVGTAEEQAQRFYNFCTEHSSAIHGMCDYKCPCLDSGDKCHCLCKWAQMPYESEA